MSREKFSAEDILLGIHFAKREVSRTRPKRPEEGVDISLEDIESGKVDPFGFSSRGFEDPSEEYLSARKELSRWNARARRYSIRREKELEGFPIEFVIPGVFLDGDRGVLCCSICGRTKGLPKELAELEETARKFRENHTHKKEGSK